MLRFAKYLVPYLMRAPRTGSVKNLAGLVVALLLMTLSAIFLGTGASIWLAKTYGSDVAFGVIGGVLLLISFIILMVLRRQKAAEPKLPIALTNDPLAPFVPEALRGNPTIQKLLQQVGENPITATATAVTVGMLLSREFFEETS